MTKKEQEAKTFLAGVRRRVRDLEIHLVPQIFVRGTPRKITCCALGAALALKAKTKSEVLALGKAIEVDLGIGDRPEFVAKVLNGGTSTNDMFQLECGFEDWELEATDKRHPFYLAGKKLRADADKQKRK